MSKACGKTFLSGPGKGVRHLAGLRVETLPSAISKSPPQHDAGSHRHGARHTVAATLLPRVASFVFWALSALLFALAARSSGASTNDPEIASVCRWAAAEVSRESGVPFSVLMAISLTETGRSQDGRFDPWPWTVNMEGKGVWFPSRSEAQAYVEKHHARGARSFDVGCFQINYRWHGRAFASLEEMFDPLANTRYAAKFLTDLYGEFGSWSRAAGAYHSRTPSFANRYRARFDRIRARLGEPDGMPEVAVARAAPLPLPEAAASAPQTYRIPSDRVRRANHFPLLRRQPGARSIGSLVPLGASPATGRRMIGQPERG